MICPIWGPASLGIMPDKDDNDACFREFQYCAFRKRVKFWRWLESYWLKGKVKPPGDDKLVWDIPLCSLVIVRPSQENVLLETLEGLSSTFCVVFLHLVAL